MSREGAYTPVYEGRLICWSCEMLGSAVTDGWSAADPYLCLQCSSHARTCSQLQEGIEDRLIGLIRDLLNVPDYDFPTQARAAFNALWFLTPEGVEVLAERAREDLPW